MPTAAAGKIFNGVEPLPHSDPKPAVTDPNPETDVVIDTIVMDFLKEFGPLANTGKYQLELTELGTFQNGLIEIKLASDDIEVLDSFDNPTGEINPGLILDPTSV